MSYHKSVEKAHSNLSNPPSSLDVVGNDVTNRRRAIRIISLFAVVAASLSTSAFSEDDDAATTGEAEKRGSQRGVYIDNQDFPFFTGR
jgi:hypothetical protein